jgi:hypothetical protein
MSQDIPPPSAQANIEGRPGMNLKKLRKAIRDICGGEDDELKEVWHKPCKHYDAPSAECKVLKSGKIPDVLDRDYEQCQLIVTRYADKLLKWKTKLDRQITDHEELDFGALFQGLHRKSLKGFDLKKGQTYDVEFWFRYVRRFVYREITRRLRELRVIPRDKKCGTCVHLSPLEPFLCELRDFVDKETKKRFRNPFFQLERKKDAAGCRGYKPKAISVVGLPKKEASSGSENGEDRIDSEEDARIAGVDLSMLVEALTEKINDPETLEKEKSLFERQRTLIIDLYQLLRQGIAAEVMCGELRRRTTDDEKERERLRKKMKEDRQDLHDFYRSRK